MLDPAPPKSWMYTFMYVRSFATIIFGFVLEGAAGPVWKRHTGVDLWSKGKLVASGRSLGDANTGDNKNQRELNQEPESNC